MSSASFTDIPSATNRAGSVGSNVGFGKIGVVSVLDTVVAGEAGFLGALSCEGLIDSGRAENPKTPFLGAGVGVELFGDDEDVVELVVPVVVASEVEEVIADAA